MTCAVSRDRSPISKCQLVAASAFVTLVHIAVAFSHGGPVAVPDVPAYLSFSRILFSNSEIDDVAFHPLYGLLLTPVGWLEGQSLHTSALVFNSVLAGLVVYCAVRFSEQLGANRIVVYTCGIIAGIYPASASASRIGWAETLITLIVLVIALLLAKGDTLSWCLSGFVAALGVAVHPRMIVALIAVYLVSICCRRFKHVSWGAVPGFVITIILLSVTRTWPTGRMDAAQTAGTDPGALATIVGQFLALSASTGGLAAIGIALFVSLLLQKSVRSEVSKPTTSFVGVSAMMMIFLGGWVLAGSDQPDTLLYGRYIDPWALPLTIIAFSYLVRSRITNQMFTILTLLVTISTLIALSNVSHVNGSGRRIMTLSLGVIWEMFGNSHSTVIIVAGFIGLFGVIAARAKSFRLRVLPIALLIVASFSSTLVNNGYLSRIGRIAAGQTQTAKLVPQSAGCLAHDRTVKSYAIWLYRLELPKIDHRRVDLARAENPCGRYVVADSKSLADCRGAQLVGSEPRAEWGLWVYPLEGCG
jgi:hypothetical protein